MSAPYSGDGTIQEIGAHLGGKSGCDGCKFPFVLYGNQDEIDQAGLAVTAVSLVVVVLSMAGLGIYLPMARKAVTPARKHWFTALVVGQLSLVIVLVLSIIDRSLSARGTRTTASYVVIYVFQLGFIYISALTLLMATEYLARSHCAHQGRAQFLWLVFGIPALAAVVALCADITDTAWYINTVLCNRYLEKESIIEGYLRYLDTVVSIIDLVFYSTYILAITYVLLTAVKGTKTVGALAGLPLLAALLMLFVQAVLWLTADASAIWTHNLDNNYYGYDPGTGLLLRSLYKFRRIIPFVTYLLQAFAPVFLVLSAILATRRQSHSTRPVVEKPQESDHA